MLALDPWAVYVGCFCIGAIPAFVCFAMAGIGELCLTAVQKLLVTVWVLVWCSPLLISVWSLLISNH